MWEPSGNAPNTTATCYLFTEIQNARFYIQFSDVEVNYLIDSASLTEIVPNTNWKEEADNRIEQIRKSDLTIA